MRKEQNIAAVTHSLVITASREIKAVVSFVRTMDLHLWLQRMPLGMPAYSGSMSDSLHLGSLLQRNLGGNDPNPGNKPGRLQLQPVLAFASCPAGTASA